MYEQFFNFMGLREDPFHVSPDPRFYYSTPAHDSALTELLFGIETRQGFLVLTGEAGTGKTSLLNLIIDRLHRLGRSSAYLFHTRLEPIGLLRFILRDFGLPCQSKSKSDLVNALHTWLLQRHAAGDLPVLILDEAQALPPQTLDELRLLLNLETPRGKLLQIILSGQPELEEKLRLPALRQLRQRIMFHSSLPVLTQKETAAYISSRLATAGRADSSLFPEEVVQDIYTSSRGIPRVVNLLCEHALISAYAERQRVVSREMIHRIAADFDLRDNPLAVSDFGLQRRPVRLAPFPVIEKPELPPVAVEPARKGDRVPSVPAVSVAPAAPVVYPKYWRTHRSPLAKLSHNSAVSIGRAWHAFTHAVLEYARYVGLALFPVTEKPGRTSPSNRRFMASWWAQIYFDIFEDPLAGFSKRGQAGPKEDPLPVLPRHAPVESPKYWRGRRSRPVLAAFARDSAASVQRASYAFTHPFVYCARSVSRSFVHDCRLLFRVLTLPMPALELGSSPEGANEKSAAHRNVLAPIVNWLRQPFTPGNVLAFVGNWLRQPVTPGNIFRN
jgi:general secretion pathway protein A